MRNPSAAPPAGRRAPVRAGFTLIELLVVIAIIAILASILFPVFAKAREMARATSCLSNMKQISLAIGMYRDDNDEQLMPAVMGDGVGPYQMPDPAAPPGQFILWFHVLHPYTKNFQIFNCPSNRYPDTPPYTGQFEDNIGYGMNPAVSGITDAFVSRPSDLVLLSDNRYFLVQPSPKGTDKVLANTFDAECNTTPMFAPHNERANVAYYDSHVKSVRTEQLFMANGWGPGGACTPDKFNAKPGNWDPGAQ
jgi:prepilin-type N-terminal cleavage/methylation domain-containing protein/prepilin-type processing-associated H-X9-DG protein